MSWMQLPGCGCTLARALSATSCGCSVAATHTHSHTHTHTHTHHSAHSLSCTRPANIHTAPSVVMREAWEVSSDRFNLVVSDSIRVFEKPDAPSPWFARSRPPWYVTTAHMMCMPCTRITQCGPGTVALREELPSNTLYVFRAPQRLHVEVPFRLWVVPHSDKEGSFVVSRMAHPVPARTGGRSHCCAAWVCCTGVCQFFFPRLDVLSGGASTWHGAHTACHCRNGHR